MERMAILQCIMAKSLQAVPSSAAQFDARVDEKIANANLALQPVLIHLRDLVHEAVPEATETIKWGMPFFELNGTILANLGIFKQHCAFGFWSKSMTEHLKTAGIDRMTGAGSLGKLTNVDDLPPSKQMLAHIRLAADHIRQGIAESPMPTRTRKRGPDGAVSSKAAIPMPEVFAEALQASPKAEAAFQAFPPSCRREYLAWITEAKRDETRARRVQQAIAQIEQGKRHNWQYETKR